MERRRTYVSPLQVFELRGLSLRAAHRRSSVAPPFRVPVCLCCLPREASPQSSVRHCRQSLDVHRSDDCSRLSWSTRRRPRTAMWIEAKPIAACPRQAIASRKRTGTDRPTIIWRSQARMVSPLSFQNRSRSARRPRPRARSCGPDRSRCRLGRGCWQYRRA